MEITHYTHTGQHILTDDEIPAKLQSTEGAIWIDVTNPSPEGLSFLHSLFDFHPLAVEDVFNHEQRPKAEEFSDHLFIILNPIAMQDGELNSSELNIFVGKNYLITLHHNVEPVIIQARQRIDPKRVPFEVSATYLLYMILDTVVDSYLPILETIDLEIDELGAKLVQTPDPAMQIRLFQLKRTLNTLWWIVWPQQDILSALLNHQLVFIDPKSQYYLRDITDHLLRIADLIQGSRDTVTGLISLYVSAVSNQLNVAVNRLTMFTIIIGVIAVISGLYGMNFEHTWPPFDAPWGVPVVLGLMLLSILVVYRFAHRR